MTDIAMDVGEFERGVRQSIAQLEAIIDTTPEAIDIVDLYDMQQNMCRLSRIIGFIAEERKMKPWKEARERAREVA